MSTVRGAVAVAEVISPVDALCPARSYAVAAAAAAAALHTALFISVQFFRDHAAFVVSLVPTRENPACKIVYSRNPAGPDANVKTSTTDMTTWGSPAEAQAKKVRGGDAKKTMAK